jgi:hypothetical protein
LHKYTEDSFLKSLNEERFEDFNEICGQDASQMKKDLKEKSQAAANVFSFAIAIYDTYNLLEKPVTKSKNAREVAKVMAPVELDVKIDPFSMNLDFGMEMDLVAPPMV